MLTSLLGGVMVAMKGFDPDPETGGGPTPDTYEDGPEGDDWMYEKEDAETDKKEKAAWVEQYVYTTTIAQREESS